MCHFKWAVGDHHSLLQDAGFLIHLKDCTKQKDFIRGSKLHANIVKHGLLDSNISIGSSLVSLYAKCGAFVKAQHVLNEIPFQNVVCWNALIAGYVQHGHHELAITCFEHMQHEGLSADAVTFACVLNACTGLRALATGKEIHAEIARKRFLGDDIVLGNTLVDLYAKCGVLAMAQQVFNQLSFRNVISWTAIIGGFCQHENGEQALRSRQQMQSESICPDRVTLLCILQACGRTGAAEKGKEIHSVITTDELLRKDPVLGNALVDMYAKCGTLQKAHDVFCELPFRNLFSWTALITGYSQHGCGHEALNAFRQMKREGFSPDAVTFASIFKACGKIGAIEEGRRIHDQLKREGLFAKDSVLSTSLVDMYAKCGELSKAQQVFNERLSRDVTTWNALITGYCQHGLFEEALDCFWQMASEGFSPNAVTFACALKACGGTGNLEDGLELHAELVRKGLLEKEGVLGSALVDMYSKCETLVKVKEVFDSLHVQDTVSWTAVIAGYCQHGHVEKALEFYEQMVEGGLSPDAVTFACILRACSSVGAAKEGESIYNSMRNRYGIIPTLEDQTCMVNLFGQAGLFDKAMDVIKRLPSLDHLPVWFALLSACQKWGNVRLGEVASEHVVQFGGEPAVAYLCLSNVYAAACMHEDAQKTLSKARRVLNMAPVRDLVSWNALIAGFYEHGCYEEAFFCYERMKMEGFSPNLITFLCILKVCGNKRASEWGDRVQHDLVGVEEMFGEDTMLGTALVDMYAKCGAFMKAKQVFDQLPCRNVVSWNAFISGYCQHGRCEEALACFEQMKLEGLSYDTRTFSLVLKACGILGAAEKGEAIHADVCRKGLLQDDSVLGNSLLDMYAKCGLLAKAQHLLYELPFRNVVSWNALITGYCQEEDDGSVLKFFGQMKHEGIFPDAVTLMCILKVCGNVGAVEKGKEIHVEIAREGVSGSVDILGSALVDMYAKCGALIKAQEVFDKLPVQDLVSWTALIAGYTRHGYSEESLCCFEQMQCKGLVPDAVTLTCVLKACSSIGAAERGQMYIETMSRNYGIAPVLEHQTCMLHLFGRAGQVDKAASMIKKPPFSRYLPAWFSLLSTSLQWGNVTLGKLAFEHAVNLDQKCAVAYSFMCNICATAAMHEATKKLEAIGLDLESREAMEMSVSA